MTANTEREMSFDDFEPIAPPQVVGKIKAEDLESKVGVKNASGTVGSTHLSPEIISSLDGEVENVLQAIINAKAHSKEMKDVTTTLNALGNADIRSSGRISSDFLTRRSLRNMKNDKESGGAEVAKGLSALRSKMEELNPNSRKGLFQKSSKLLGFLPFGLGKKTDNYFKEFENADSQLKAIVESLYHGKDRLIEDNAHIDTDREKLYKLMQQLEQYAYLLKRIDEKIKEKLPEIEDENKIKADDIKSEILFPLSQKRSAILQQLAVSFQGYLALQVARKNNVELINSVDRTTNTTMEALRIAVVVSEVLASQRLVLNAVNAVNEYGNQLIANNAKMLSDNASIIQEQATQSAIDTTVLAKAFEDIFKAMDQTDKYRIEALPKMQKTLENLEETVMGAKKYLEVNRQANVADFSREIAEEANEPESSDPEVKAVKIKMNK